MGTLQYPCIMAEKQSLTFKEQARALWGVAKLTFQTAPGPVVFKLVGSVVNAILPIATTYFAARTTTYLALAFTGDADAKQKVLLYIVLTALLGLVRTAWSSVDQYVQAKMRYIVDKRVSTRMYEQFLSLEYWRYDDKNTADLYDKAAKFSRFFGWVFDRFANIITQLITVIAAIGALLSVNVGIALFIFVALMPGIFVQFRISRAQVKHWNKNVDVRRSMSFIEWDLLHPRFVTELRMHGMVRYLLDLRNKLQDKDESERLAIQRKAVPLTLLSDVFRAVAEVGALIWVSLQIMAKNQQLGQFVFVQQIVGRAISASLSLVSVVTSIDEDVANLFDYETFMRLPTMPATGRKLVDAPKEIAIEHVSFHYPKTKKIVLHDVSLRIKRDQHIAIVGENGAGKTTLIKLITGLYRPTKGQVLLDGHDLADYDSASWHSKLGVLGQNFIQYAFATARENVQFGDIDGTHTPERLQKALEEAEAADFTAKLPRGVESYVHNWMEDDEGNKGTDLSGGQWQRLALARDFYRSAPIVILDEPTSAIDALAEARIFKRLFSKRNRTVITISHRLSTVKKADVIYMLKDGRLVETGTYAELIAKHGEFYRMFESQIKD